MEAKDYVLAVGVAVTLLLGIWNLLQAYRTTRKTSFINTVTGQRIKWIEQLRQDVASFCGLTHTWCMSELEGKPEEAEVLKELDRLRHVIRLRLNPDDTYDRKIAAFLKTIPDLTHSSKRRELLAALEELTSTTQLLIKEEWEKVKAEAKDGDLAERKRRNA
ncbi:MAG: hypothetical protein Q8N04_00035 [Nitrospira sp.]|nr:hypothetical protein [Nitrospira sp.]